MEQHLFKGETPSVIRENLEGIADKIEQKGYVKPLAEEEIQWAKDNYLFSNS
jgi:hypothetical protein